MTGRFVTFEGVEGSGKSTQIRLLKNLLEQNGQKCLLTREPGGTETGQKLRELLLNGPALFPVAELFLFLADRNQHIHEVIIPALKKGIWVLCDRFYHSTLAYQAGGRKIPASTVITANAIALEQLKPDCTFLLDIPVKTGFERKKRADFQLDRIELEKAEFHESIRQAYLELADQDPVILKLDGTEDSDLIHSRIAKHLGLL